MKVLWMCLLVLTAATASGATAVGGGRVATPRAAPDDTLTLMPEENGLRLELAIHPRELTFGSELDANGDGRVEPGEWRGRGKSIASRILADLRLWVNDELVTAAIAGLAQSYESPRLIVRAHFPAQARGARVALQSPFAALVGGSRILQVKMVDGDRTQWMRMNDGTARITFQSANPARATGGALAGRTGSADGPQTSALLTNETAVGLLLGLLLVAGIPPALFCAVAGQVLRARHRGRPAGLPLLSSGLPAR